MTFSVRRVFFWSHLALGLAAGLVILIMCVTGVLMTYEKQVEALVDRFGLASRPQAPGAQPLPMEELIRRVRAAKGSDPESVTLFAGTGQPVEVNFDRKLGSIYADAYTGAVIGAPSYGTYAFFRKVREWHRWLAVNGPMRKPSREVVNTANAVFLALTIVGLYLWMPRQWTWRHVRAVALLRTKASGHAREFNWHNAIGLWASLPLLVMVWTGMAMHYPWAKRLTYQAAGTPLPAPKPKAETAADDADAPEAAVAADARFAGLDPLLARAERQAPGWKAVTLEIPDTASDPVDFTMDRSGYDAVGQSAKLELDRNGRAVSYTAAGSDPVTAKNFIRYGHTGELWGVPGQTVAGLASLGGVFLVWTGISLSIRRLLRWRGRTARRAQRQAEALLEEQAA